MVQGNGCGATVEAHHWESAVVEVVGQPIMFPKLGLKNAGNVLVQLWYKSG